MKGHALISLLILLTISESSIQLILKAAQEPKDLKPDASSPERNLVVVNHYEDRRKEYEAAKCKTPSYSVPLELSTTKAPH